MPKPIKPVPISQITQSQFRAYEAVRVSGYYNMIANARDAAEEAGLGIETYMGIVRNYEKLMKLFPKVRKRFA